MKIMKTQIFWWKKKKKKKKKKKNQEILCKYNSSTLYYELAHNDSWYNMLEYLKIQRKYR